MVVNKLFKVSKGVAQFGLAVDVDKPVFKVRVRLGCIRVLWQGFPTFCYAPTGKRGGKLFLFKFARNSTACEECFELCEVLTKGGWLSRVEYGCPSLATDWHKGR